MKNPYVNIPIFIGVFTIIISILAISVKVGEQTMMQTGLLKANQSRASVVLGYSDPDLISIRINSIKEVVGGDFVLKFNVQEVVILPSTLRGETGFITSGGESDLQNGVFSFSLVNPEGSLKDGILATFRIARKTANQGVNIEFDTFRSRIIDVNSQPIAPNFLGL